MAIIYIRLKSYLDEMQSIEAGKPESDRRHVPTLTELAESIGKNASNITRIANHEIKHLNLETAGKIITEMRRRGFPMKITDLLDVYEPD